MNRINDALDEDTISIKSFLILLLLAFGGGTLLGLWLATDRSPMPLRYLPTAHIAQLDPSRPPPNTEEERIAELVERRLTAAGELADPVLIGTLANRYKNREHESYPATGVLTTAYYEKALAPLEINTRPGGGYFVKLIEPRSNRTVMTAFISGGSQFETTVPLGSYELRYAAGSEWYGSVLDFGPTANYFRSPETFQFMSTNDGYRGYTVELILQAGGNLRTTEIDAEEF